MISKGSGRSPALPRGQSVSSRERSQAMPSHALESWAVCQLQRAELSFGVILAGVHWAPGACGLLLRAGWGWVFLLVFFFKYIFSEIVLHHFSLFPFHLPDHPANLPSTHVLASQIISPSSYYYCSYMCYTQIHTYTCMNIHHHHRRHHLLSSLLFKEFTGFQG